MSAPLLPHPLWVGIFAITALLFDTGLEPHLKETLLQLMALAWASPISPKLSYAKWACPQLTRLTGESQATLYGHLKALRTFRSALRLRNAGSGQLIGAHGMRPPRKMM